ncbi:Nn.00g113920.m01.CDS01 [Neocucurbitaria sp. VM-36]
MYIARKASSKFACKACSKAVSRSCTSISKSNSLITSSIPSQYAFSTSTPRREDKHGPLAEDPEFAFLYDSTKTATNSAEAENLTSAPIKPSTEFAPVEPTSSPSIPWYLRQQASVPSPVQKPAELPDLPPNPPPLLETLLEYVSITAGLDDLQLLDLRHLDPPPALGPKLIMLIATARSEKHLHVAADRFCRWLRREHGLKANAAGLLGRNELKIKLRRKAKRMRMLANVGGTIPEGNIDDGIRTGWICCTIGKIEAHPDDMHMPGDNVEEFVGFRDVKPGVNVVVQMFTEEKRAETDLETLWGGVLRTHQRKDRTAEEALKELEEDIEELENENDAEDVGYQMRPSAQAASQTTADDSSNSAVTPPSTRRFHRPRPSPGDVFPPATFPDTRRQLRKLHTFGLR